MGFDRESRFLAISLTGPLEGGSLVRRPHLLEPENTVIRRTVTAGLYEIGVPVPVHVRGEVRRNRLD